MPSGQKTEFHNDFPVGDTGVKEARKTGKTGKTEVFKKAAFGKSNSKVTNT